MPEDCCVDKDTEAPTDWPECYDDALKAKLGHVTGYGAYPKMKDEDLKSIQIIAHDLVKIGATPEDFGRYMDEMRGLSEKLSKGFDTRDALMSPVKWFTSLGNKALLEDRYIFAFSMILINCVLFLPFLIYTIPIRVIHSIHIRAIKKKHTPWFREWFTSKKNRVPEKSD